MKNLTTTEAGKSREARLDLNEETTTASTAAAVPAGKQGRPVKARTKLQSTSSAHKLQHAADVCAAVSLADDPLRLDAQHVGARSSPATTGPWRRRAADIATALRGGRLAPGTSTCLNLLGLGRGAQRSPSSARWRGATSVPLLPLLRKAPTGTSVS